MSTIALTTDTTLMVFRDGILVFSQAEGAPR